MTFDESLAALARRSDAELGREWTFRGVTMDVGYAMYYALEEEQRAVIDGPHAPTESARILSLAQSAFGDLRGLIAGLDDDVLDHAPADDQWSLRETLAHELYNALQAAGEGRDGNHALLKVVERLSGIQARAKS